MSHSSSARARGEPELLSPANPQIGGERRSLYQSYLDAVDWTYQDHVVRALRVFEQTVRGIEQEYVKSAYELRERDGYQVLDNGRIVGGPVAVLREGALAALSDPAAIRENLSRISRAIEHDDPAQAIGSAKELIESTAEEEAQRGHAVGWYHYGQVEATHLRRLLDTAIAEPVLQNAADLLTDVIRPNFYGPSRYGLKQLACAAGASWRTAGASGLTTLDWIEKARAGDAAAWQQLLDYNEDDTRATKLLRGALREAVDVGWALELGILTS